MLDRMAIWAPHASSPAPAPPAACAAQPNGTSPLPVPSPPSCAAPPAPSGGGEAAGSKLTPAAIAGIVVACVAVAVWAAAMALHYCSSGTGGRSGLVDLREKLVSSLRRPPAAAAGSGGAAAGFQAAKRGGAWRYQPAPEAASYYEDI